MEAVLFVPGIMGTELLSGTGEKLWPPKPLEVQFGYGRADKLLGNDVRHGKIIENVACFDIYGSLFAQFAELGFQPNGSKKRLYLSPYDWRLDLARTAEELARLLDRVDSEGAQDIYLVAHSMGGLVCRLVLETGTYANRPWFKRIKMFIAMATPHQGAPLALARVLGLDSTLGISKSDFRKLAGDPRYPSAYQLLPAPNEAACWSKADLTVSAVDIYDTATATRLGLNPQLLTRARFVHDGLARGSAPPDVRYFYFAGTGHETVTRVNVLETAGTYPTEEMVLTRTEDAGDGTVPFWSALPRAVQKQVVVNEHAQVFRGTPFKRVFYRLLGGDLGVPLESLGLEEEAGATRLSIPTPVIHARREFELLLVPITPTEKILGTLLLQKLSEGGTPVGPTEDMSTISYEGPRLSRLRLLMPPVSVAGFYELLFKGAPANSEPLRFAVVSLPE
jgi:phospholipase A1